MAIVSSILGKIKGKLGNVSCFETRDGKTVMRALPPKRKMGTLEQQRREEEFGTLSRCALLLPPVVKKGFPKGGGTAVGKRGFIQANMGKGAVVVEAVNPEREFVRREGEPKYFRGRIDYTRIQVAGGVVTPPSVSIELPGQGATEQWVKFVNQGSVREGFDCFREDRVYGIAFCPSKRGVQVVEIGVRGETAETENAFSTRHWQGDIYFYAFATSADGKRASASVYLGLLVK